MVRVSPKILNRWVNNTSFLVLKNTIGNENQCWVLGTNTIVTTTTDLQIHNLWKQLLWGPDIFPDLVSAKDLFIYLFICESFCEMGMVSKKWEHPWSAAKALMFAKAAESIQG